MSIRRRLLLSLLTGLGVLAMVCGSVLYVHVEAVLTRQFDAALLAKAGAICSLVKQQPDGEIEVDFSTESMPEFGTDGRQAFFQIWQEDGARLMRSPSLGEHELALHVDGHAGPLFRDISLPGGRSGRAVALRHVPAADDDLQEAGEPLQGRASRQHAASVYVVLAQDRGDLERTLATLLSAMLLAGTLLCVGTFVITTLTLSRGLRPLQQVADEAASIDEKSLHHRFSVAELPGELQPICRRLNESLERLEEAFQRERRFTADVAHELRTPIAELRSLADVALKWQGEPETSSMYFRDAQQIAQQMEAIVTALLSLARCRSGAITVSRQPVSISDVLKEAWPSQERRAAHRGLAVSFEIPAALVVETDRTMFLSMVGNLLSNAVEYTPGGGAIACKAESSGSGMTLTVTNDTDSLTTDDLPHLFEAFWRKDPARTDGSHCGLGLTLVDAYATILGGKVEASMPKPDSVCITLALGRAKGDRSIY